MHFFSALGFLAFRLLGFSHPLHSQFKPGLQLFGLLVALAFRILCFPSSSPAVASRILSITSPSQFESSLLRTSWKGRPTPPQLFGLFAKI